MKAAMKIIATPALSALIALCAYVVTANPMTVGTTGPRAFCSDATGIIRSNPSGTATYNVPLCDQTQNPLQ